MLDFSLITSLKAAEEACLHGDLIKILLLPAELGGRDIPENVVYVPPHVYEIKEHSTAELLSAVRMGMREVAVVPVYRGASVVPAKISITAARAQLQPGYEFDIGVW